MTTTPHTSTDFPMVATTFAGLEETLAKELLRLGAKNIQPIKRGVSFEGDLGFMYKANFCLRTALRILKPINQFKASGDNDLYEGIYQMDWTQWLEPESTFVVDVSMNTDNFNHSLFVAQKTKDAIVDKFRQRTGKRPSIDKERPELRIHVHIFRNEATVLLDSSGDPLYKRGYRSITNVAPLNEVMAAGMIALSGWDPHFAFIDGMCGSGTISIEAAMLAAKVPAGYFRDEFGFMRWRDFDQSLWDTITEAAINKINSEERNIIANDISRNVLKKAKENIHAAKVEDLIKLQAGSFMDMERPANRGTIILNPPYGERMQKDTDILALYKSIGDKLKKDFSGWDAWIITSNMEAAKNIGLRHSRKITLYNGALECKFLKFEMYQGTKKLHKIQPTETNDTND